MTIDDIIRLASAGFTKSDIFALAGLNSNTNGNSNLGANGNPSPLPSPSPKPNPNPNPNPSALPFPQSVPQGNGLQNGVQNGLQNVQTYGYIAGQTYQFPHVSTPGYQVTTHGVQNAGVPQGVTQSGQNADVLSAINNLTQAVQSRNINTVGNVTQKKETTEDVIAHIINPDYPGLNEEGK